VILVIAAKPRHLIQMPAFAKALAGNRSTGSKQTLNGLFYLISVKNRNTANADPFLSASPELFSLSHPVKD
jgi:hypothetical protein